MIAQFVMYGNKFLTLVWSAIFCIWCRNANSK